MRLLLALLLSWCCAPALALSVAFINPGRADEQFWRSASEAMQAAARSLGVELEVLYAERQPERALALGREIAARPATARPDYVILVNEKGTLVRNAQVLGAAGIPSFAAFSGLLPQERRRWAPRQSLHRLLGSLVPDAEQAGYLTAKALIEQARQRAGAQAPLQLLSIAGDRSTPVSIERNEGLRRALREARAPRPVLVEQLFAEWQRGRAQELALDALQRHPQLDLVWAGSDQMTFGAMEAAEQLGRQPGRDILFAGINTSREAMQAVLDGRLTALAGGHFLAGAWALLMLHDYHHGFDFAPEGLEQEQPMFMLFGKAEARRYLARFGEGMPALDFRPYSRRYSASPQRLRIQNLLIGPQ